MNLKKIKIISIFLIFLLSFICHYVYTLIPSFITSIFFPVNESIWEHMKLLFTSIIIGELFELIFISKFKIPINNYFFSVLLVSFISIPIYLLLYLPFYYKIGHNFIFTLILLFITICIINVISYNIQKTDNIKYLNNISFISIIICYIIFGYLTYHPFKTDLFFDPTNEKYGLNYFILLRRNY